MLLHFIHAYENMFLSPYYIYRSVLENVTRLRNSSNFCLHMHLLNESLTRLPPHPKFKHHVEDIYF